MDKVEKVVSDIRKERLFQIVRERLGGCVRGEHNDVIAYIDAIISLRKYPPSPPSPYRKQ